jgi:arylsulfatase A-like enzyme
MAPRPNIVIIMTDQQRADTSAREGFPLDTTPFLDSLARQGVWFDHAYTAAPICAPARVSLLTGRFPSAHHVRENRATACAVYERDLIDVLREQGYATGLSGKNHSHLTPERLDHWFSLMHNGGQGEGRTADERAFDDWLAALPARIGVTPTPFPLACQCPYRAVSDAQHWVRSLDGQPFFLWLSFPEPHNPYQVPEPYFSLFPPETQPPVGVGAEALARKGFKWQFLRELGEYAHPNYAELIPRARANYFGMLRLIDDQVRRFVTFLDEQGLRENTLLVFLSDHGDFAGDYGLVRKGPEMPEVLMRVPLFVTGPGIRADEQPCADFISLVDLVPTLCEALGVPTPAGVQGRSLWPLLTGGDYPAAEFASVYAEQGVGGLHYGPDDALDFEHCLIRRGNEATFDELNSYSQSGAMRMLRRGDWKLVCDMLGQCQLYDLARDPLELDNLYGQADYTGIAQTLLAELLGWTIWTQDPLPYPPNGYRRKANPRNYRWR